MKKILQKIGKFVVIASVALTVNSSSMAIDSKDLLDMSLEDLMNMEVTTASKKAESLNDAPGIISVISRQEIEGFYAENLG